MIALRSGTYLLCLILMTPLFLLGMLLARPFGYQASYALSRGWCVTALHLARWICRLDYRLVGTENIPSSPVIVLAKHQSAWETFMFPALLPRQVQVVKRELLHLPFFGWGLAMTQPIAIDRGAGREALAQVEAQGRDRLAQGLWILIFPEGTRVAPGTRGRYGSGGALLARRTGTPILPVAHNAGEFWRRNAFMKYPGTITVSFGPLIDPAGLTTQELNRRVEDWIETEVQRISTRTPHRPQPAAEGRNEPISP